MTTWLARLWTWLIGTPGSPKKALPPAPAEQLPTPVFISEPSAWEVPEPESLGGTFDLVPWQRGHNAPTAEPRALRRHLLDSLQEMEQERLGFADRAFVAKIQGALARQGMDMPPFPDTVLRLRKLLHAKQVDAHRVADLVRRDPALAKQIWRKASGVAFGRPPSDLRQAIVRLGNQQLWRIAVRMAVHDRLFQVKGYGEQVEELRMHSSVVADVAGWMLGEGQEQGTAWLAGLLHDSGKLFLYRCAGQLREQPSPQILQRIMDKHHAALGSLVVTSWKLGETEAQAVAFHHGVDGAQSGGKRFAQYLHWADIVAHTVVLRERGIPCPGDSMLRRVQRRGFAVHDAMHVAEESLRTHRSTAAPLRKAA
jgi:HD-like signal output (HDOD) protein